MSQKFFHEETLPVDIEQNGSSFSMLCVLNPGLKRCVCFTWGLDTVSNNRGEFFILALAFWHRGEYIMYSTHPASARYLTDRVLSVPHNTGSLSLAQPRISIPQQLLWGCGCDTLTVTLEQLVNEQLQNCYTQKPAVLVIQNHQAYIPRLQQNTWM